MELEILESDKGHEIKVYTDRKIAVAVQGNEERIYLPETGSDKTSYYSEEIEALLPTEYGYKVTHTGNIENVEVLG